MMNTIQTSTDMESGRLIAFLTLSATPLIVPSANRLGICGKGSLSRKPTSQKLDTEIAQDVIGPNIRSKANGK